MTQPDKAQAAAEEIAGFGSHLIRLEVMIALILAGVLSLVVKTFWWFSGGVFLCGSNNVKGRCHQHLLSSVNPNICGNLAPLAYTF
jgi:hypothetical protein